MTPPSEHGAIGADAPAASGADEHAPFAPLTREELDAELPQYEVRELIGHGGMGAIFKAYQPKLERMVAIKVIHGGESDFAEHFRTEAMAMAKLHHTHIVTVYDFGQTSTGVPYFIMEYIEGNPLSKLVEAGKISPQTALSYACQVCDALHYAHAQGVVHRDIKPANVLLSADGLAKVADFGLAKLHTATGDSRGLGDSLYGTPEYVAPEVTDPNIPIDFRADIYAIGVLLYEMLVGVAPSGIFELPSKLVKCDPRIDAVIVKAMKPNAAERHQSAGELRADLDHILTTPAPKIITKSTGPIKPRTMNTGPPASVAIAQQRQETSNLVWVIVGAIVTLGTVLLMVAVLGGSDDPPNNPASEPIDTPDPLASEPVAPPEFIPEPEPEPIPVPEPEPDPPEPPVVVVTPDPDPPTPGDPLLESLEALWTERFEPAVVGAYTEALSELNTKYRTALEKMAADATAAAKLDTVLAVQAELKRLDEFGGPPPVNNAIRSSPGLLRAQDAYRKLLDKEKIERNKRAHAVYMSLDTELEKQQIELTKKGEVEEAIKVRDFRKNMEKRLEDLAGQ